MFFRHALLLLYNLYHVRIRVVLFSVTYPHILAKEYENIYFVFATAHPDYALEAFELYSFDYIIKPFDQDRIKKTVRKLKDKAKQINTTEIPLPIKTKDHKVFLKPSNILYIEAYSSGNIIKTINNTYITNENMGSLEEKLKQYNFFRCHRSYLVNLQYIKEIIPSDRTFQIILNTGEKVPLSRKQEKLLKIQFQQK